MGSKCFNMKRILLILTILFIAILFIGFQKPRTAIIGRINPPDGSDAVWVVGEKDSLKTNAVEGQFYFEVRAGNYKLVVDAKAPYKDAVLDNLSIKQEETLDVGEITLKQ